MRKYPKYKETGIDGVGKVPEHWKIIKLKYIAKIFNGQDQKDVLEENGEYPIYGSGGIFGYANQYLFEGPSVLLGRKGTVDKPRLVQTPFWSVDTAYYTKISNKVDTFIFYHLCNQINFDFYVYGSAIPSMTARDLNEIKFPLSPLPEQLSIVRFLDYKTGQIDSFIANRQKQIELLKEQKAGIINKAVTKGINPNVSMKDSGIDTLGIIPENWDVMELKFAAKMMRGKFSHRPRNDERLYGGNYPFIQTGDVTRTEKYITSYKQTLNEWGYSVSKMFPKGTVVITIAANIGDIAILDFDACFPDSIVGFYPKKNKTEYIFYLLKTMKDIFLSESIEGTQLNLSVDRLSSIKVAIPGPLEQQNIVDFINEETSTTETLISKYQKQIDLMQEYRTSLVSQAVTGKIDVREWEPKREAV